MLTAARILVADHAASLPTIAKALERRGAVVARAESGGELIERLADEGPFALVVTEVNLPWMNGLQAMYAMRHAGLTTPIIVMTALTEQRIPEHVRRLGGNAVLLRKPFDLTRLESLATQLLSEAS